MKCHGEKGPGTGEAIPTRDSLLSRLKRWDDRESWNDFFNTYWKLIFSTARRAGLTDAEAQDVVQETVISVSKRMPDFKYNPAWSFKSWLLQVTRWRINDQLRKRLPIEVVSSSTSKKDKDRETELVERQPDPAGSLLEAEWDAEWEKN